MRSYYAHLKTIQNAKKENIKPTFRSSAIFPVFNQPGISTRILFMGYWILKRNIKEIAAVFTLRSQNGKILFRKNEQILEPKTYRLELNDFLQSAGFAPNSPFLGSLELEFFSTQNLVFPFPATVLNYYGPNFSSVVHTAQRIYNDFDDMRANSQTKVQESGFNLYADNERDPFFAIVNGWEEIQNASIHMTFYNAKKEMLEHELKLGTIAPFQTTMIYPSEHVNLKGFLGGKVGAGKIRFQVNWAFPRIIVGNIHKNSSLSITHTYYDCTKAVSEEDYWFLPEKGWHPASLMVPVSVKDSHYTNVYFYPIYSPSIFDIDIEIYNKEGKLQGQKKSALHIETPKDEYQVINFKEICHSLKINTEQDLAARIIARAPEGKVIPARIKLGFDLGIEKGSFPCNICTNLQPFNPALETKPQTFRWSPVLTNEHSPTLWILNSSPQIDYTRPAQVEVTFFREKDAQTKSMQLTLPPNGFTVIRPNEHPDLKEFFGGDIGWMTAVANNPYTTTFYFVEHASGTIGGDHGF